MDIYSEQKSQYKPYSEAVVSRARPPMIKKPNNLFLTGDIELFPEYRTSYVPYSLDSIYKFNKPPCYHPKPLKKVRKASSEDYVPKKEVREEIVPQIMSERSKPLEAKILNNNYGVPCPNRYHQKLDSENNNYMPEYTRQYQAAAGQRSQLIPQPSHLGKYDGNEDFRGSSEYTNRYKTYDHFTKSAPIKKEDNLHMIGVSDMRPEYKERYNAPDMNAFERRHPYRQVDNLQSEGDFGREPAEYHEKYKHHHVSSFPERAKPKNDFLGLNGNMEYAPEYRNNYVEFPRQRPIVKRPPTNIRMPSGHDRDRKPDNIDLPINMSYHETGSTRQSRRRSDEEDVPIENRPEYRRAMLHNMIKERSPSRGYEKENPKPQSDKTIKVTDPNDVSRILMENKVNMPEEKIFDENNEVIVEPIKKPTDFKIPTRSPVKHPSGKNPSYPLLKGDRFNEEKSQKQTSARRANLKVVIDDYDNNRNRRHESFDSQDEPRYPQESSRFPQERYSQEGARDKHQNSRQAQNGLRYPQERGPQEMSRHQQDRYPRTEKQPQEIMAPYAGQRKSPKFGRRGPNPVEEYNIRTKTNVVEANPRYIRERRNDIQPNRHEQRGYYHQSNPHPIPMAQPPTESLANNYRPNYEIDKQQNYRESLKEKGPFVVIDNQMKDGGVKPNSWMKKQWYDTN